MSDAEPTMSPPAGQPARLWKRMRQLCVIAFVTWHLFFLFISNTKIAGDWSDSTVGRYESYLGIDQRWGMFSSPVWKYTPFLAVRIEFTDGSSELVLSDNEPADIKRYFKTTMARLRKYEEHLLSIGREDYGGSVRKRDAKFKRFAEWRVAQWFERHPDDEREVKQVVLLKRRYEVPPPGEDRNVNREPSTTAFATVSMDQSD